MLPIKKAQNGNKRKEGRQPGAEMKRPKKETGGKPKKSKSKPEVVEGDTLQDEAGHQIADSYSLEQDSATKAQRFFEWFIAPLPIERFWSEFWQKKPLVIKRERAKYYDGWYSKEILTEVLKKHPQQYTHDIDVAQYVEQRYTHNPPGLADPKEVWKFFESGSSIRVLRPMEHVPQMWQLVSILEEYLGSGGGANVYLTPAGAQGFAPHFDDIEAFVMQVEGSKVWKLYSPRDEGEMLARESSSDFTQEEVGDPMMEVKLDAGDLLYFPRGWIHQAVSPPETASTHITVSCAHKHSWYDLMAAALPIAMQDALDDTLALRAALPRDFSSYMGMVHSGGGAGSEDEDEDEEEEEEEQDPKRQWFTRHCRDLFQAVANKLPIDEAADEMAKQFLDDRLPPYLLPEEKAWMHGGASAPAKLTKDCLIRVVRKDVARLVVEGDNVLSVYHCLGNSRNYHGAPLAQLNFETELGEIIEAILSLHPHFAKVSSLPDRKNALVVATALFEAGVLQAQRPSA